jgi:hypothetical protein
MQPSKKEGIMTTCSWEFGFDANCTETSLQAGFVKGSTVADSSDLESGDTIVFHLFDITAGSEGSGFTPIGALLTFTNGNTSQTTQYPFNNFPGPASVSTGEATIQVDSTQLGSSTTASSPFFSNGTPATFPRWTMTGPLTINVSSGQFMLQVQVTLLKTIAGHSIEQVYSIDPEMVVGSIG